MNKELIKKYKDIFDYWLDGGKVIAKNTRVVDTWVEVDCDEHWDCTDINDHKISFVKNDQYAEFRKALADGKIIQLAYRETCTPIKWKDITDWGVNIPMFPSPVEDYRIKPDESKFKVGDWVRTLDWDTSTWKYISQIKKITSEWEYPIITEYGRFRLDSTKLWQPKPGEWCWFWDAFTKDAPLLTRFIKMTPEGYYTSHSRNKEYSHCEPFVGTLPSSLKD